MYRRTDPLAPRCRRLTILFLTFLLPVFALTASAVSEGPAVPLTAVDPELVHPLDPCLVPLCSSPEEAVFGAVPSYMRPLAERLFFGAYDGERGAEPWISDGTVAGTGPLVDVCEGPCDSEPVPVGSVVGPDGVERMLFWATSAAGRRLWTTDGTAAGTVMLPDVCAGTDCAPDAAATWWLGDDPASVGESGVIWLGQLYFGSHRGLHVTDGTVAGTRLMLDPCGAGGCAGSVFGPTVSGGRIWFLFAPLQGPWHVGSVSPGGDDFRVHETGCSPLVIPPLVAYGDGVAFVVGDNQDGSEPPCSQAPRLDPVPADPGPLGDRQAYLFVATAEEGREVARFGWYDVPLESWKGYLLLGLRDADGNVVWASDGTSEGTRPLVQVAADAGSAELRRIIAAGDDLYLVEDAGGRLAPGILWRVPGERVGIEPLALAGDISPESLVLLGEERPLWSQRDFPGVAGPFPLSWDVVAGPDPDYFQFFSVGSFVGPGGVSHYPLAPRMQPVGDRLFFSVDGGDGHQLWVTDRGQIDSGCLADSTVHCLQDGRFEVRVRFTNQHAGGAEGIATPVNAAEQGDSGLFWFFRPDNLELTVKVLDGRGVNGHWWVFSGGSTDLEYELEVLDRQTGQAQSWRHAPGDLCSVVDTTAFAEPAAASAGASALPRSASAAPVPAPAASTPAGAPECDFLGGPAACVGPAGRFSIRVTYTNQHAGGATGTGEAFPRTRQTATTRFFPNGGVETMIKVLDGRPVNGHWWVLWGGLTNLGYTVEVLDRETEAVRTFTNPVGSTCGGADTTAFAEAP